MIFPSWQPVLGQAESNTLIEPHYLLDVIQQANQPSPYIRSQRQRRGKATMTERHGAATHCLICDTRSHSVSGNG